MWRPLRLCVFGCINSFSSLSYSGLTANFENKVTVPVIVHFSAAERYSMKSPSRWMEWRWGERRFHSSSRLVTWLPVFLVKPFEVSIPVEKALSPYGDVLLAYEMNGEPLNMEHGAPARVIAGYPSLQLLLQTNRQSH